VKVRDLLRRVLPNIAPEALQRGVHLSCQGDSDLQIWTDPDHLLQIALNLALNAVQATPPGGAVVLRAFATGTQVTLEVSDTGCGIPKELLSRVNDPFFTTKTKGVGLGLSISRQLCELNGGKMTLDSSPGRGTVVQVSLPNAQPSHANHPDH